MKLLHINVPSKVRFLEIKPENEKKIFLPINTHSLNQSQVAYLNRFYKYFYTEDFTDIPNLDCRMAKFKFMAKRLVEHLLSIKFSSLEFNYPKGEDVNEQMNYGFRFHAGLEQSISIYRIFLHFHQVAKPLFNLDAFDSSMNVIVQQFYNDFQPN